MFSARHSRHRATKSGCGRAALGVAVVLSLGAPTTGCGGTGQPSADDFERTVVESTAGSQVGADVAKSYARCLYRETDGRVEVLVEHLEDGDYRPVGPEAEALVACSDKLNAGD